MRGIYFQDIVLNGVDSAITIDQEYDPSYIVRWSNPSLLQVTITFVSCVHNAGSIQVYGHFLCMQTNFCFSSGGSGWSNLFPGLDFCELGLILRPIQENVHLRAVLSELFAQSSPSGLNILGMNLGLDPDHQFR